MDIIATKKFTKAIKKLPNDIHRQIKQVLIKLNDCKNISEINNIKKLVNYDNYFRIRIGRYRLGIQIINNTIYLINISPRGDFYKFFPPE